MLDTFRIEYPAPVTPVLDLSDRPKLTAVGQQRVNLAQYDCLGGGGLCQ